MAVGQHSLFCSTLLQRASLAQLRSAAQPCCVNQFKVKLRHELEARPRRKINSTSEQVALQSGTKINLERWPRALWGEFEWWVGLIFWLTHNRTFYFGKQSCCKRSHLELFFRKSKILRIKKFRKKIATNFLQTSSHTNKIPIQRFCTQRFVEEWPGLNFAVPLPCLLVRFKSLDITKEK